jgi:hypothetical protein
MPITNIGLPTSFVPTSITGCRLWLDGADPAGTGTPPATGATVSTWADKSGNSYNATATGAPTYSAGTLNGKGSITCVGNSSIYFTTASFIPSATGQITVFFVLSQSGNISGNRDFFISNTGYSTFDMLSRNGFLEINIYSYTGFSQTYSISQPTIASFIGQGSPSFGGTMYVNGGSAFTLTGSSLTSITSAMTFRVGGYGFQGQLYEIIIYNTALNITQQQSVEQYLAWKWGLASQLPTSHLGYKGPPVAFGKVPYYTAFSPLSIPTCALWLDAADSSTVTGTTTVTAWSDKSGNGRPVTITSAPSYGTTTQNKLRTLAFNNNQVTTSIASAVGTGDFTLIAVWYQSTGGTNTVLSLGTSGSSSQSLGYSATKYNFYQFGSAQESAYTTSAGSWVIQVGTRISSVKTVYINGIAGTTPSIDSFNQTVTTVTIGRGDSFGITGQIGEILIYTGTIAQTDQQKIESYLAQKWGLTAQLPLTHLNTRQPAGLPAGVPQVLLLFTALSRFMSTYYNLSGAYALANIADSVTGSSATPAYIWTVAVPSGAKGKNGILAVFFNMYSATLFTASQYFDYGIYVDGVSQMLGDATGTLRYVQTAGGNYAMSSNGVSLGTNGLVNGFPLIVPLSFLASASQIQIGIKNSSSYLSPITSSSPGYSSNVTVSTGTINTSSYIPINTFTVTGSNTYTVPTNTTVGVPTGVYIYCWGAGGQGFSTTAPGGPGGYTTGYYACAPGATLTYVVGAIGGGSIATGGAGASAPYKGGGFSGVFSSASLLQANVIAIAGGGGGAGNGNSGSSFGGAGGGLTANNGYVGAVMGTFASSSVGGGGTQSAGGFANNDGAGGAGGALTGAGTIANDSGSGGGGYYGGGGAGGGNGAGGGSAYIGGLTANSFTQIGNQATGQMTPASAYVAGPYNISTGYVGSNSPYYPSGGTYGNGNGSTGLVVIVPAIGTNPVQIGVSAALYSG